MYAMQRKYISASRVARFLYCPFTLELEEAGYEPREQYIPAIAEGTALHTAFGYIWNGADLEDAINLSLGYTSLLYGQPFDDKMHKALEARVRAIPDYLYMAKAIEVKIEAPIPNSDYVVFGYVDAIFDDKIVDLKAVSRSKSELSNTYLIQAQIYLYATGLPRAVYCMINEKGQVSEFEVKKAPSDIVEEMLRYFIQSMEQFFRPPSGLTGFVCEKCAFRYACPFVSVLSGDGDPLR
jgi:CRISPR/Cas system-associated exonuclease Cas4 (RecB family)